MIEFVVRADYLHVGARGRGRGGPGPGAAEVVNTDGTRAGGYLIGGVLHVDAHRTAAGPLVPAKAWEVWIELDRFRVTRRVAQA